MLQLLSWYQSEASDPKEHMPTCQPMMQICIDHTMQDMITTLVSALKIVVQLKWSDKSQFQVLNCPQVPGILNTAVSLSCGHRQAFHKLCSTMPDWLLLLKLLFPPIVTTRECNANTYMTPAHQWKALEIPSVTHHSQKSSCCMISLNLELLVGNERLVWFLLVDHPLRHAWTRLSHHKTPGHLPLRTFTSGPESSHLGNWRSPEVLNISK